MLCSFIVSFSNHAPDPERDSAAIQEFLSNMEAAFRAHPLWTGCSEEELESAGEVSMDSFYCLSIKSVHHSTYFVFSMALSVTAVFLFANIIVYMLLR